MNSLALLQERAVSAWGGRRAVGGAERSRAGVIHYLHETAALSFSTDKQPSGDTGDLREEKRDRGMRERGR